MNRALKTFLLWLLLAALPLQGMAAAIQASCGPAHLHSGQAAPAATHNHFHEAGAGHDAAGHDHSHAAADAARNADDASASSAKASAHGSCSACAACCIGATAPPPVSFPAPYRGNSESVAVSPPPLVAGFIPGGLERPPKRLSA